MPRLHNFPETIYMGMDKKGEIYTIPDKDPVLFITTMGICKTMSYTRSSFYCEVTLKTPKPALTSTVTPKEQDNASQTQPEALPKAEKDLPAFAGVTGILKPKKRHCRTKAEDKPVGPEYHNRDKGAEVVKNE